jgi:hypothetical protein
VSRRPQATTLCGSRWSPVLGKKAEAPLARF